MITSEIKVLIDRADESHQAAKLLLDKGFLNFSAAQSYYTMFYLAEALLYFERARVFEPLRCHCCIWKRVCKN